MSENVIATQDGMKGSEPGVISPIVLVDYSLSPEELLRRAGLGRVSFNFIRDPAAFAAMQRPAGMSGEREVRACIFKPRQSSYHHWNGSISYSALQAEYDFCGLTPDLWLSFALNIADSSIADQYRNIALWPHVDGRYGVAEFDMLNGDRFMTTYFNSSGRCHARWWHVGRCV